MTYYGKDYFNWQKQIGEIGGYLNKFKFEKYIEEYMKENNNINLLDFGCGGGYLLNNFDNVEKIGFEINKEAHKQCKEFGIKVTDNWNDILDNSIDVIISNHAMEHVSEP